jgi:hypothetical protein
MRLELLPSLQVLYLPSLRRVNSAHPPYARNTPNMKITRKAGLLRLSIARNVPRPPTLEAQSDFAGLLSS